MPRSEHVCRFWFQAFTMRAFVSCRPSFLERLELDGYCKAHELAFEYQGIQHYQYVPFMHKTRFNFELQQERDERKKILCKRHGIYLIVVPYWYNFNDPKQMSIFVYDALREAEHVRGTLYIINR
jgi:hypothetical protein